MQTQKASPITAKIYTPTAILKAYTVLQKYQNQTLPLVTVTTAQGVISLLQKLNTILTPSSTPHSFIY